MRKRSNFCWKIIFSGRGTSPSEVTATSKGTEGENDRQRRLFSQKNFPTCTFAALVEWCCVSFTCFLIVDHTRSRRRTEKKNTAREGRTRTQRIRFRLGWTKFSKTFFHHRRIKLVSRVKTAINVRWSSAFIEIRKAITSTIVCSKESDSNPRSTSSSTFWDSSERNSTRANAIWNNDE